MSIKFTISQNAQDKTSFHYVLCLSEAKGMDTKMDKRRSYIYERIYVESQNKGKSEDEVVSYWKDILGSDIMRHLEEKTYYPIYDSLSTDEYSFNITEDARLSEIEKIYLNISECAESINLERFSDILFYPFYKRLLECGLKLLAIRCDDINMYLMNKLVIQNSYLEQLIGRLNQVSTRALIQELNICKKLGELSGKTPEEEYQFYLENQLTKADYYYELMDAYPVLFRILFEIISMSADNYALMLKSLENDKEEIELRLCEKLPFNKILKIKSGISDFHRKGKSVFILELDNMQKILFKPRSLKCDEQYQKFIIWLGANCDIKMKTYKTIDRDEYGWCEYVPYKVCDSERGIVNYYKRLGILIFSNYLLQVYDIHYENIIARGEYPIIVDLETIMANYSSFEIDTARDSANKKLWDSVLHEGILPKYIWGKDGKSGINLSGIAGVEGQEFPVKMPILKNVKRSDMHIDFEKPVTQTKRNFPMLGEKKIGGEDYVKEIVEGFNAAYNVVLMKKAETIKKIEGFRNICVRYLARDTQQYASILQASYHPDYLQDGKDRELLLCSLYRSADLDSNTKDVIIKAEIKDLLNGDIPYFSYNTDRRDLYDSQGKVIIKDYFQTTSLINAQKKVMRLNEQDKKEQTLYIILSMAMLPTEEKMLRPNKNYSINEFVRGSENGIEDLKRKVFTKVNEIAVQISKEAIYTDKENDITWIGISLDGTDEYRWNVAPLSNNLYDGLAGLSLFFNAFDSVEQDCDKKVCKMLNQTLFQYTDSSLNGNNPVYRNESNGAFSGDSSLMYLYELLYSITKKQIFLEYAEKQYKTVKVYIQHDKNYDLIYGNAGVVLILLNMFKLTGDKKYLSSAIEAGSNIINNSIKMETGIGWIPTNVTNPLAGFSHGNSGIAYALLNLYSYTDGTEFYEVAQQAIEFENTLYNVETKNWLDMRVFNGKRVDKIADPVHWCHGAAGILLSRIKMLDFAHGSLQKVIEEDIIKAVNKVLESGFTGVQCLCHGDIGNLDILAQYAIKFQDEELLEQVQAALNSLLEKTKKETWNLGLMMNIQNIGFMLGTCGIGYNLLRFYTDFQLPSILSVEI